MVTEGVVVVTAAGSDIETKDGEYDAHLRAEEDEIYVDVFDSHIEDATEAHIRGGTWTYPRTTEGAAEITERLQEEYGFTVTIVPRKTEQHRMTGAERAARARSQSAFELARAQASERLG
jgi:FAD synthase